MAAMFVRCACSSPNVCSFWAQCCFPGNLWHDTLNIWQIFFQAFAEAVVCEANSIGRKKIGAGQSSVLQVTTNWTNTFHFRICRETQHSPTETELQFISCLDLLFIFSSITSISPSFYTPGERKATNWTCDRSDNFDAKSGITNMGHNSRVTGHHCDRSISSCHSCGIKEYRNVRTARWHRGPVVGQLKRPMSFSH